jgi:hypothetical protein
MSLALYPSCVRSNEVLGGATLTTLHFFEPIVPNVWTFVIAKIPDAKVLRAGLREKVAGHSVIATMSFAFVCEDLTSLKAVAQSRKVVANPVAPTNFKRRALL